MLKKSLHAQIPIILGLKNLPDAVALPSHLELLSDRSRRSLPPETQIVSVFDAIGEGSRTMLILGQPGAGKTIALLQLAQVLLDRASEDYSQRIPVVLNLSSWAQEKKTIADWLVQELHILYGVAKKIGKVWVEEQELLLLLDGLDEVRNETDRVACVEAINTFQQQYLTEIAVCCRIRDYKVLRNQLHFRRAVYLKHLTRLQIEDYLTQLGIRVSGLKTLIVQDVELQKLARLPLMLNTMVLAYEGVSAEKIPSTSLNSSRTQQIFDTYIDRLFRDSRKYAHQIPQSYKAHEKELYPRQQAKYWLIWLAKQMVRQSQTVFLIERLQPTLLKGSNRTLSRLVRLSFGLIIGLIFGLSIGLSVGLSAGLSFGLRAGLFYGLIAGLRVGLTVRLEQIELVEALNWSWSWKQYKEQGLFNGSIGKLLFRLILWLLLLPIFGLLNGLSFELMAELLSEVDFLITIGLIFGLSFFLTSGLFSGLQIVEVSARTKPNQGVWRSAKNCLTVGLFFGLIMGLLLELSALFNQLSSALFNGLSIGLGIGLSIGLLQYGGLACIQHFVLRCLLFHRGVMPWNYVRFLNWASDKLFLQQAGGGYIFVHRLLMEHFAQMDLDESSL